MRLLGAVTDRKQASLFADYLLAQGIPAKVLEEQGTHEVWVQNEDQTEPARALWAEFQSNPKDSRFHQASSKAAAIKKELAEADRRWQLNFSSAYDMWGRPHPSQAPLTVGLIVLCVLVALASNFGTQARPILQWLTFTNIREITALEQARQTARFNELPPESRQALALLPSVIESVGTEGLQHGQLWRLLTPILIHFGIFHLAFNMYALYGLGTIVEARRGWKWLLLFIVAVGVVSNVGQYLLPHLFDLNPMDWFSRDQILFGGMSGVLYGLFGYLWMKTKYAPEPGLRIPPDLIWTMLIWLLLCTTNWLVQTANSAHVFGLVCGLLVGAGPKLLKDLRKKM